MSQIKVLLCVLGNDIHVVANRMLEILCVEQGCQTRNLGALSATDEILQEIELFRPALVLVSTLNGQGYFEAKKLMNQLRARKSQTIRPDMWIGGNLFVGDYDDRDARRYLEMGFDQVFSRPTDFSVFTAALGDFIGARHSAVENACQ